LDGVNEAAEALNDGAVAGAAAAHFDDCIVRVNESAIVGDGGRVR
jgi:hypothetical protein